ncbi:hypothetical protein CEPID_00650 [Corynebacterium epidermidicanis]|uniref:Uncharacterized protein n=1 Tax=Corynebacterium epidermidicanis TaxID=1050174 RepID=A0A0G3GLI0_9CORY|nr:hypothetical protein CEPID_00650 [Corynebacterium epidermidicanis]
MQFRSLLMWRYLIFFELLIPIGRRRTQVLAFTWKAVKTRSQLTFWQWQIDLPRSRGGSMERTFQAVRGRAKTIVENHVLELGEIVEESTK